MKKSIFFLIAIVFNSCLARGQQKNVIAFQNVNVIPMDKEIVLKDMTVLISGSKIIDINKSNKVKIPSNAQVIDGKGKYLMPGLSDMHVHINEENDLILYLANGVTTVRNMNGKSYHLVWRDQIRSNERLGPELFTSGPTLYGQLGSRNAKTVEEGVVAVRTQKRAGYDFIKVYHLLNREVYDAIINEAKIQGMPVVGHKPARHPFERVFAGNQISLEHLIGYPNRVEIDNSELKKELRKGNYSFRYSYGAVDWDETKIKEIAKLTKEAAMWNCPTLIAIDVWAPDKSPIIQEIKSHGYWKYVSPFHRNLKIESYSVTFSDYTPKLREQGMLLRRKIVKELHNQGAKLLLGTDAGAAYVPAGFSIIKELQNLVEAGLSPYEAIKTGTVDTAEFLNELNIFGTIEKGKRADLILLDFNPLKNVNHIKNKVGVMVKGKWITTEEFNKKLEKIALEYQN